MAAVVDSGAPIEDCIQVLLDGDVWGETLRKARKDLADLLDV